MSAIAWFYVVHRDLLLRADTPIADLARQFGRETDPDEFPYSGYLMMDMLLFLEDRGIPITRSASDREHAGSLVTVLTAEHRPLLPNLDPALFSLVDMRQALQKYDLLDDEIIESVTDTLNVLRNGIANLADDQALVILIG